MGYFGTVDQREFDKFKEKVLERLDRLQEEIRHRATDSEELAKAAALNVQAIEVRLKTAEVEASNFIEVLNRFKAEATLEVEAIKQEKRITDELNAALKNQLEEVGGLFRKLIDSQERISEVELDVAKDVQSLRGYLEEGQHLPSSVETTKKLLEECKDSIEKINSFYEHSFKRKRDIDALYRDIFGEDHLNQEGNSEHIDGIKDHLENSYKEIADKIDSLDQDVLHAVGEITEKHEDLLKTQRSNFTSLIESSQRKVASVQEQLTSLLPGAMAEGLSAAYESKKAEEIIALGKFERNFQAAIVGMIFVSIIPLLIDSYLIFVQGKDLVQVIKDTPGMIAAILPLYFPVLWLAHSSNKKYNLSKRLIEEYTHKSVLGKTFSGLSNQIESLQQQGTVKEELRNRLLHNVLQVSAENPGKLITDYQKSDHPLMEALENSVKLADAISKLSKVPGFGAMARKISEKNEKLAKEAGEKVEEGLKDQELLEEKDAARSDNK